MSTKENKLFIQNISSEHGLDPSLKWKRLSKSKHDKGNIRIFGNNENAITLTILEDKDGNLTLLEVFRGFDFSFLKTRMGNDIETIAYFLSNSIIYDIKELMTDTEYKTPDDEFDKYCSRIASELICLFTEFEYDLATQKYKPTNNIFTISKEEIKQMYYNEDYSFLLRKMNNIFDFPQYLTLNSLEYGYQNSKIGENILSEKIGIEFDGENFQASLINDNGISYLKIISGGDWEYPVTIFLFLNKESHKLEYFFPYNNKYCYNIKTKKAYGHEEDEDDKEIEMMENLNGKLSKKAEESLKNDFYQFLITRFKS